MRGGFIDASAVLLVDTGKMRASFIPFSDGEQAGIGSALDRALYHDQGTATLPARRLLPEEGDRKVEDAILRIYDAHIRRATQ